MGASRPLAPCTVITRTWSAVSSVRRLTVDLGAVEPGEEAGEAGGLDALVGEGLVDEGVDAVLGLGAEAGGEAAAAVVADEDAGEELVGAEVVGLGERGRARRARTLGPAGVGRGARARGVPARGWARSKSSRSERPPSGAAEEGGEGEVVGGGGGEAERGEEVVDGELAPHAQEVGAGDGDAGALQLADDGVEELGAALDEDHHVAGADGAASVAGEGAGGGEPAGDLVGDAAARTMDRVVGGEGVDRGRPRGCRRASRACRGRARARRGRAVGGSIGWWVMPRARPLAGGSGEDGVDEGEDRRRRSGRSAGGRSACSAAPMSARARR